MSSSRQLSDGFYLERSQSCARPSTKCLLSFLDNLLLDFERRLTIKIFDLNRTLTSLSSEDRRTALVDNVPVLVFERAFGGTLKASGKVARTVKELLNLMPVHSLVRKHYAGDFTLVLPILRCNTAFTEEAAAQLPTKPFSPNFFGSVDELFVALRPAPFSDPEDYVEVFSPFPGEGPSIDCNHYPTMRLSCGETDFVFPPSKARPGRESDEEDGSDEAERPVELLGVQKGDVSAAAKAGELSIGDVLLVRGKLFKVKAVTGGGMPWEVYGGADLIVFDRVFTFNARKVSGHRCLPVLLKAKHGFIPSSFLDNFAPVEFKFLSSGSAKKLGMGSLQVKFRTLAFNEQLICHRDSFLRPGQYEETH